MRKYLWIPTLASLLVLAYVSIVQHKSNERLRSDLAATQLSLSNLRRDLGKLEQKTDADNLAMSKKFMYSSDEQRRFNSELRALLVQRRMVDRRDAKTLRVSRNIP